MSDPSRSATPNPPCYRCRTDPATAPCAACPLYGAYLERSGWADSPSNRESYAAFVTMGGWALLWRIHGIERRLAHHGRILAIVRRYPRASARLADLSRSDVP